MSHGQASSVNGWASYFQLSNASRHNPFCLSCKKALLKKLIKRKRTRLLYVDHIETDGRLFFQENRENGPGRHRLQAEKFSVQSNRETLTALDQSQKFAV